MFRLGATVAFVFASASPDVDLASQFSDDSVSLLQLRAEKNYGTPSAEMLLATARSEAIEHSQLQGHASEQLLAAGQRAALLKTAEPKLDAGRKGAMAANHPEPKLVAGRDVVLESMGVKAHLSVEESLQAERQDAFDASDAPGMGMGGMMGGMGNMGGMMGMGNMGGMMGGMMGRMGMMGMMGMGGMGAPDDEAPGDEAEAVGDPHLTTLSGMKKNLCCSGKKCTPCGGWSQPALLEEQGSFVDASDAPGMGMGGMMGGMGMMGMMGGMGGMGGMMGRMGMMGGMMGMMGMGGMGDVGGDNGEAEAVGDPHLTMKTGAKLDLCCDGKGCKPCPVALLEESDEYYSYYYYEEQL